MNIWGTTGYYINFLKDMCCGAWNNPKVVHKHSTTVSWLRPEEELVKLDADDNSL
jgi:hypothetical protein